MVYLDTTPIDIMCGMVYMVANLTILAGGLVAERLGDPSGRIASATAAVYASILGAIAIVLLFRLATKSLIVQLYAI